MLLAPQYRKRPARLTGAFKPLKAVRAGAVPTGAYTAPVMARKPLLLLWHKSKSAMVTKKRPLNPIASKR